MFGLLEENHPAPSGIRKVEQWVAVTPKVKPHFKKVK
jgi:hypothetical protein